MKKYLLIAVAIILTLNYCERDRLDSEPDPQTNNNDSLERSIDVIDKDIILKVGKDLCYSYSDIELYDSSTHILYFKTRHPEFDDITQSPFEIFIDEDTIYKGDFWPIFFSSFPPGPYISNWPYLYQNYALRIDNRQENKPDPRNDPRIIQALTERNLMHSGLFVKIVSVECNDSLIIFSFSVTNQDQSELLIMDPDKMGLNLYHYYTNGLVIRRLPWIASMTVKIPPQAPSPWNGWKVDWLYKINPGESKSYVFNYPIDSPLNPGDYNVTFVFPGLEFQVSKEDLVQNNGRIWLGSLRVSKDFVVQ
jgi:hypothetical protein